jgi:ParB family chromosome partitioning protein
MLSELEGAIEEVPVDQVAPNRFQPRKQAQEEGLAELVDSIRTHGILQPLVVRRMGSGLELIAGERRLEAAKRAGLQRVPVVVRQASDREMVELALVENLQREDINPMDAAEAYARLVKEFGLTQEQVAERVGKSRPAVANTIRLLSLPSMMQEGIRQGKLEEGHGKILAGVADDRVRLRLFRRIVRRGI